MAAPAVAGGVAVILSVKPHLIGDIEGIKKLLQNTAEEIEDYSCGSSSGYPNKFVFVS